MSDLPIRGVGMTEQTEGAEVEAAVWVSPRRMGGQPCLLGHRLTTAQIARLVRECGIEAIHEGWPYITDEQVEIACWFEDWLAAREAAAEVRGAQAVLAAVVSPEVLEEMRWRIEHYGPADAAPFQYSRYASPAHAAFSAVEDAARAAAAAAGGGA